MTGGEHPNDAWFELFGIEELLDSPRAADAGGRPIVVWRTAGGRVVALDDACPHQGTELSAGTVVGESLRCVKHGWEVGTDGWCDNASAATGSYRVEERDGRIWVRVRG